MTDSEKPNDDLGNQLDRLKDKTKSLSEIAPETNEKVSYIGHTIDVFDKASRQILARRSTDYTEGLQKAVAHAGDMAGALERSVDILVKQIAIARNEVDQALPVFSSFTSVVTTTCNSFAPEQPIYRLYPNPFSPDSDVRGCTHKLTLLDPALGETYRGAWNAYYGQQYDRMRSALFEMRHVFDHLFALLGPDEDSLHLSRASV